MDEKLRIKAQHFYARAQELDDNDAPSRDVLAVYLMAAEHLNAIQNKTPQDYENIAKTAHKLAVKNFNSKQYNLAAEHYLKSIEATQKSELDDNAFRELTKRYIDLSDSFLEMFNKPAAEEAINNAIKAFQAIKIKTEKERAIGDPITNFTGFHHFYEKTLSTKNYIQSAQFQNHAQMLQELQQEQALLGQFADISIQEQQQIDNSIEAMLSQLSLVPVQPISIFSPMLFKKISDSDYRNTARSYLQCAKTHLQNGAVKSVVTTYEQAINTLKLITQPNDGDQKIITELTQQISFLRNKSTAPNLSVPSFVSEIEDTEMGANSSFNYN